MDPKCGHEKHMQVNQRCDLVSNSAMKHEDGQIWYHCPKSGCNKRFPRGFLVPIHLRYLQKKHSEVILYLVSTQSCRAIF